MSSDPVVRKTFSFGAKWWEWFQSSAEKAGMMQSRLIREAVEEYFEKRKPKEDNVVPNGEQLDFVDTL